MPDISVCKDGECPSRESCYRFMAKPCGPNGEWQCYGEFPRDGKDKCEYFMRYWRPRCDEVA